MISQGHTVDGDYTNGQGWGLRELRLPVSWYQETADRTGVCYPISGDRRS